MKTIAIVGATGAVGLELLHVLEKRAFPIKEIRCFASPRSQGKKIFFRKESLQVEVLQEGCFCGVDIAFFAAGSGVSQAFAPQAVREGAIVIDKSSAFRMDKNVPLVVPEINAHALRSHSKVIASPSCTTTIMLMAAFPLHRAFHIQRIVATTYQAASGGGKELMEELVAETRAHLDGVPFSRAVAPHPYAFNLFLHNSPLQENGYVDEELKMVYEARKILDAPSLAVTATCVRVPILRAHSMALNIACEKMVTKKAAEEALKSMPGLKILEDPLQGKFPMPIDAAGKEEVLYGRVREDLSQSRTLDLWVVGDQLLKGAALNAVQIAEHL